MEDATIEPDPDDNVLCMFFDYMETDGEFHVSDGLLLLELTFIPRIHCQKNDFIDLHSLSKSPMSDTIGFLTELNTKASAMTTTGNLNLMKSTTVSRLIWI